MSIKTKVPPPIVALAFGLLINYTKDEFPKIQAANNVVILPTIIFYDDGEEVQRLQGDMSFTLKTTTDELDEIVEEILGNKF